MKILYVPLEIVEIIVHQLDEESVESLLMVNSMFLHHIRELYGTSKYWKSKLLLNVLSNPEVSETAYIRDPQMLIVTHGDEVQFWKDRYRHYMATLNENIFVSKDPSDIVLGIMIYDGSLVNPLHRIAFPHNEYYDMLYNAMFSVIEYGFYESFILLLDHVEFNDDHACHIAEYKRHKMLKYMMQNHRTSVDFDRLADYCIKENISSILCMIYDDCTRKMELIEYAVERGLSFSTLKMMILKLDTDAVCCALSDSVEYLLKHLHDYLFDKFCEYLRSAVPATAEEFYISADCEHDDLIEILLKYDVIPAK